jgi:hypothetical protein
MTEQIPRLEYAAARLAIDAREVAQLYQAASEMDRAGAIPDLHEALDVLLEWNKAS